MKKTFKTKLALTMVISMLAACMPVFASIGMTSSFAGVTFEEAVAEATADGEHFNISSKTSVSYSGFCVQGKDGTTNVITDGDTSTFATIDNGNNKMNFTVSIPGNAPITKLIYNYGAFYKESDGKDRPALRQFYTITANTAEGSDVIFTALDNTIDDEGVYEFVFDKPEIITSLVFSILTDAELPAGMKRSTYEGKPDYAADFGDIAIISTKSLKTYNDYVAELEAEEKYSIGSMLTFTNTNYYIAQPAKNATDKNTGTYTLMDAGAAAYTWELPFAVKASAFLFDAKNGITFAQANGTDYLDFYVKDGAGKEHKLGGHGLLTEAERTAYLFEIPETVSEVKAVVIKKTKATSLVIYEMDLFSAPGAADSLSIASKFKIDSSNFAIKNMNYLTDPQKIYDGNKNWDNFCDGAMWGGTEGGVVITLGGSYKIAEVKLKPRTYMEKAMQVLEIRATNDNTLPYSQWDLLGQTWNKDNVSASEWVLSKVTTNEATSEISALNNNKYKYVFLGRTGNNYKATHEYQMTEFELYVEETSHIADGEITMSDGTEEVAADIVTNNPAALSGTFWDAYNFQGVKAFDGNTDTMAYWFHTNGVPAVIDLGEEMDINEIKLRTRSYSNGEQSALVDVRLSNTKPTNQTQFEAITTVVGTTPEDTKDTTWYTLSVPAETGKYRYVCIARTNANYAALDNLNDIAFSEIEVYAKGDSQIVYTADYNMFIPRKATLILAVYEGTKLIEVKLEKITLDAGAGTITQKYKNIYPEDVTVKAFIWNGMEKMNALNAAAAN